MAVVEIEETLALMVPPSQYYHLLEILDETRNDSTRDFYRFKDYYPMIVKRVEPPNLKRRSKLEQIWQEHMSACSLVHIGMNIDDDTRNFHFKGPLGPLEHGGSVVGLKAIVSVVQTFTASSFPMNVDFGVCVNLLSKFYTKPTHKMDTQRFVRDFAFTIVTVQTMR
jgi:hypothetical protein